MEFLLNHELSTESNIKVSRTHICVPVGCKRKNEMSTTMHELCQGVLQLPGSVLGFTDLYS